MFTLLLSWLPQTTLRKELQYVTMSLSHVTAGLWTIWKITSPREDVEDSVDSEDSKVFKFTQWPSVLGDDEQNRANLFE